EEDRRRRGVTYRELDTSPSVLLNLNDAGQVAFSGSIAGSGVSSQNDSGIWAGRPDDITPVARTGETAPGTGRGVMFSQLQTVPSVLLLINEVGQVAFHGRLSGPGVDANNSRGLWAGSPGEMSLLARGGDPAPGAGDDVYFHQQPVIGFVYNRAGQVCFLGRLTGASVDVTNERAIWMGDPDDLRLVVREGDPAPGVEQDWRVLSLAVPAINGAGQLAFTAMLEGSGVQSVNRAGLWLGGPDDLSLAIRAGEPAPGAGDDVKFYAFTDPVLNGAGQIAFKALLQGRGINDENGRGIWCGDGTSLGLVARAGDTAPDAGSSARFDEFGPPLVLNAAGEVAFRAELTGEDVFEWNDRGIWAGAPGSVRLVVREGDTIQVGPGDRRTIEVLSFGGISGGEDGRNTSFNNAGQLVFSAYFTDGSRGVFVANTR
ncbi:MAG: DUF7453 family protein, partial [Planctomycetota bacterium]